MDTDGAIVVVNTRRKNQIVILHVPSFGVHDPLFAIDIKHGRLKKEVIIVLRGIDKTMSHKVKIN